MSEHHETVTVEAPVQQVYAFFTHFNDFPKFMTFVKEVTYLDDQRSHWVVQIAGTQEWDAVNENWEQDQQVGWRSTDGLENKGIVHFTPLDADSTRIDVYIAYTPPAGLLGQAIDKLSTEHRFSTILQQDLKNFVKMVEAAPPGALDPMQSHYLFHENSAAAQSHLTSQQTESMQSDPMMSAEALQRRSGTLQSQQAQQEQERQEQAATLAQEQQRQEDAVQQQDQALRRQAEVDATRLSTEVQETEEPKRVPHPVYDTIGGRNASMDRTAIGDQDGRTQRFPEHHQDPMTSRAPSKHDPEGDAAVESPWRASILGTDTSPDDSNTPSHP